MYELGIAVKSKHEDYHEYVLTIVPGESNHMLLVNVKGYKAGSALGYVKTALSPGKHFVSASISRNFFVL